MDCVMYLVIFFTLVAVVDVKRGCFTDVGCFDLIEKRFPNPPEKVGTQFQLFTRNTKENHFTVLNYLDNSTLQGFDRSKKTFVVVHGFTQNATSPPMVTLRKAILNKFDANVIMVDWRNGSGSDILHFLEVALNTQLVGRQTARLLQLLTIRKGLDIKNVHLIGLSLGAEANGFAGKWFKIIANNTIGRITGLDTAGPWFQLQNSSYHLTKTDADFVDAIHSSSGKIPIVGDLGILTPVGHVDFYPNGGRYQPQCPKRKFLSWCSHVASLYYFVQSMTDDSAFASTPCPKIANQLVGKSYWTTKCKGTCQNNCGRMGYYSNIATGRGLQYLTTNPGSCRPYCQG